VRAAAAKHAGAPGRATISLRSFGLGLAAGLFAACIDLRRKTSSRPPPSSGSDSSPARIPLTGWRDAVVRSLRKFGEDRLPAAAAGATYFALLALVPAISAFVSLYGLIANIGDVRRHVVALAAFLPSGAISVVSDELARLTSSNHTGLGVAFFLSLAVSIWSANAGVKALIDGLNVAYEAKEHRGFISLTLVSLSFTTVGILLSVAGVAVVVSAPAEMARLGLPGWAAGLAGAAMLVGVAILALSLLYKFGPCRPRARWRWITPGGCLGALSWIAMSALFSWYVANFGHYDRTYGSLGAIVGALTWIWLSLMVVMYGAEFNSQIERQSNLPRSEPDD
jgi:membrane protein